MRQQIKSNYMNTLMKIDYTEKKFQKQQKSSSHSDRTYAERSKTVGRNSFV